MAHRIAKPGWVGQPGDALTADFTEAFRGFAGDA